MWSTILHWQADLADFRKISKQNRKLDILLLLMVNHDALLYFCRRSPKEASCDVSLNLAS